MQKWLKYLILVALWSVTPLGLTQGLEILVPPASLSQWYKPLNKRQVWLHTMFSLRREMQAISEYAALEDREGVVKWAGRLVEHYRKIGDMVPEWRDELELVWADRLMSAAEQGDFSGIATAQRKIGGSCRSCHREYRAVAAAIYRTPDYGSLTLENSQTLEDEPFSDVMQRLSTLVNRIKIAVDDERLAVALESLDDLNIRLGDLAAVCGNCHQDRIAEERILGASRREQVKGMQTALEQQDRSGAGKALGVLAVEVCARCHGVHRTLYDLKQVIVGQGSE